MINEETKVGGKAISWLPEGNGFVVSDQNELEKELIPKYFKEKCLFQSFVRGFRVSRKFLQSLFSN